jgi:hypothetical protein
MALALCAAGVLLVTASTAGATHIRPTSAKRLHLPLVPTFDQCTASNRTHGPPLAFPSCNPPVHSSDFLTVGTKSEGFMDLFVHVGAPGPPTDSELLIKLNVTDVRCKAGTTACGNANSTGGPDYTGHLQGNAMVRITDHWNATSPGGGTDPATIVDIPFPVDTVCSNTADPSIGASCAISTSTQPMIPDPCSCEGKRMVVAVTQFRVSDGGADGITGTTPNTPFLSEGLFIP